MINKKCKICDKSFKVFPYQVEAKYCSSKCFGVSRIKRIYKKDNKCIICDKSIKGYRKYCSKKCTAIGIRRGISSRKKTYQICGTCGKSFYGGKLSARFCSQKCYYKFNRGKNHGSWQGGKSSKYDRFKQTKEYKKWRLDVFSRDNYTCQDCGFKNGGGTHRDLHPHHIKSASKYIKNRLDLDNGITLCLHCHGRRHSINFKNKKYKKNQ